VLKKTGVCTEKYIPPQRLTLVGLFGKAMKRYNGDRLWHYSAYSFNCQQFVKDVLNSNGITQFDKFIKQDTDQLAGRYVKAMTNIVTDIAAVGDAIFRGGSSDDNLSDDAIIRFV